ncbi:MAG: hypothetical protein IH830_03395 [Planctomycetes bacterium]|nr:hypothetical protein [Planctomycetota bacterium]
MDRNVLGYITADVAKSPDAEEGGKFVGYLLGSHNTELQAIGLNPETPALVVTDYLPSGPNAVRSAVELLPDGEYQERLFRQIEGLDSDIEHLGSWHSHHCNGLRTLSDGDLRGYFRTVNKTAYRLDWFLVSLVTRLPSDPSDANWIDHYVFVRGEREYHRITNTVKVIDRPTRFGQITTHSLKVGQGARRSDDAGTQVQSATVDAWYETAEGRRILAEDRDLFAKHFKEHVTATRRASVITLAGRIGPVVISMIYPSDGGTSQVAVSLRCNDVGILKISSELKWRWLAMNAALAGAAELR